MAIGFFRPCPHCGVSLSYLEGVASSTRTPRCPRCRKQVEVRTATFLMIDTSRLAASCKPAEKP
jgi:hypothetical protein